MRHSSHWAEHAGGGSTSADSRSSHCDGSQAVILLPQGGSQLVCNCWSSTDGTMAPWLSAPLTSRGLSSWTVEDLFDRLTTTLIIRGFRISISQSMPLSSGSQFSDISTWPSLGRCRWGERGDLTSEQAAWEKRRAQTWNWQRRSLSVISEVDARYSWHSFAECSPYSTGQYNYRHLLLIVSSKHYT